MKVNVCWLFFADGGFGVGLKEEKKEKRTFFPTSLPPAPFSAYLVVVADFYLKILITRLKVKLWLFLAISEWWWGGGQVERDILASLPPLFGGSLKL